MREMIEMDNATNSRGYAMDTHYKNEPEDDCINISKSEQNNRKLAEIIVEALNDFDANLSDLAIDLIERVLDKYMRSIE
jgi:hypothetical protein